MNIEGRVEMLEFQNELLFNGTDFDKYLYETGITRRQYRALMDLELVLIAKI